MYHTGPIPQNNRTITLKCLSSKIRKDTQITICYAVDQEKKLVSLSFVTFFPTFIFFLQLAIRLLSFLDVSTAIYVLILPIRFVFSSMEDTPGIINFVQYIEICTRWRHCATQYSRKDIRLSFSLILI